LGQSVGEKVYLEKRTDLKKKGKILKKSLDALKSFVILYPVVSDKTFETPSISNKRYLTSR